MSKIEIYKNLVSKKKLILTSSIKGLSTTNHFKGQSHIFVLHLHHGEDATLGCPDPLQEEDSAILVTLELAFKRAKFLFESVHVKKVRSYSG